jgi:phosphoenolpyruvate---glycerone phosphotransferase subunit DhaM
VIGIVVVSHSPSLAAAAVELAREMVRGRGPAVEVAAGTAGGFGTDATEVAAALERAASPDGVLVLMDLGSAVMNAELALELAAPSYPVRLSSAPLVEGLVAAVVRAAGGADLEVVAREAEAALTPKVAMLRAPDRKS